MAERSASVPHPRIRVPPQSIVAGLTSAGDSHVYRVPRAFTCIQPIEFVGHRKFNMAYIALGVVFLLVVGLMVGCAIVSTGSGAAVSGTNSAKSSWAGSGNVSGSMTPTFANGEIFTGRFFQATSNLTDELGPPKTPLLMGGCCRTLSDDSTCPPPACRHCL